MALLVLLVWLYASILTHLFLQWIRDPNFSHGILVPIFALFVIWQDYKKLEAIPPSPSWAGLPLVVLSMLVLVLGVLGADIFLPRVSLLILLAGLIILFQGWTFFRAVLFPWAFLILMIPIPALIIKRVTFPLQVARSKAVSCVAGTGCRRAPGGKHNLRCLWAALGRRGSMQRNPFASKPDHAGHYLRLPDGDSEMGAGSARTLGGADRSGG